jgi:hypothetical protein
MIFQSNIKVKHFFFFFSLPFVTQKSSVYVVYTRWKNLKKTNSMVDGQVGFHRPENVRRMNVEKNNSIVNALNKTKKERHPDLFQEQQDRMKEIIAEKKQKKRMDDKKKRAEELQRKQEKEAKSYDRIMGSEQMKSNKGTLFISLLVLNELFLHIELTLSIKILFPELTIGRH